MKFRESQNIEIKNLKIKILIKKKSFWSLKGGHLRLWYIENDTVQNILNILVTRPVSSFFPGRKKSPRLIQNFLHIWSIHDVIFSRWPIKIQNHLIESVCCSFYWGIQTRSSIWKTPSKGRSLYDVEIPMSPGEVFKATNRQPLIM